MSATNRLSNHSSPADCPVAEHNGRGLHRLQVFCGHPVRGPCVKDLRAYIELINDALVATRQLDRTADDSLQHGTQVERRAESQADLAECPELADGTCFNYFTVRNGRASPADDAD